MLLLQRAGELLHNQGHNLFIYLVQDLGAENGAGEEASSQGRKMGGLGRRGHFPSHGRADGEVGLWRTYLQDRGMDEG